MKNNKGSVLVWAVVIILIFSIFAMTALAIGYSMVSRSYDNNLNRQLYLTARSGGTMVANEIISPTGTPLVNELIAKKDTVLTVSSLFTPEKNMGSCAVSAIYISSKAQIIVTAVSTRDNKKQTFSSILTKNSSTGKWAITGYDSKDITSSRG